MLGNKRDEMKTFTQRPHLPIFSFRRTRTNKYKILIFFAGSFFNVRNFEFVGQNVFAFDGEGLVSRFHCVLGNHSEKYFSSEKCKRGTRIGVIF